MGEAEVAVDFTKPEARRSVNKEGVVTLAWKPAEEKEGLSYELQQSESADFSDAKTRYQGADRGSVLSGLQEGEYHFRIRSMEPLGEWSEPVTVEIDFISKQWVISLLVVGVIVFIATVGTLLIGHFRKPAA